MVTVIHIKYGLDILTYLMRKEVNWYPILQATYGVEVNDAYLTYIIIIWWRNQIHVIL